MLNRLLSIGDTWSVAYMVGTGFPDNFRQVP